MAISNSAFNVRFGEYLVLVGDATAAQVLVALGEQRRRRPFLPELMVRLGFMSDTDVLRLYRVAEERGQEFIATLHEEGKLSRSQALQIDSNWRASGPPIGVIMTELGMISNETREQRLREFAADDDS